MVFVDFNAKPHASTRPDVVPRKTAHYETPSYRADIDGLRAIAVLSVVAHHVSPLQIKGGFVGVDMFFVISGFLISTIVFKNLERGDFSLREFYARRVRRILPALILVLVASLVFGWFMMLPRDYRNLGKHVASGVGFALNFSLIGESGYFDGASSLKPLLHLWSLSIEEQFYLAWPVLVILWWKYGRRRMVLLYAILAASLISNVHLVTEDRVAAFYLPWTRFWELLVGAALALAAFRRDDVVTAIAQRYHLDAGRARNVLAAIGVLAITASLLLINSDRRFPGYWALLPTLGTAALIAAGPSNLVGTHVLSRPALVLVGLISYPLYLWHWALLSFLRNEQGGFDGSREIRLLTVALSLLLAWVTYRFVEQPIRTASSPTRRSAAVVVLIGLASMVGLAGFYVFASEGVTSRFPEALRPLLAVKYDHDWMFRNERCLIGGERIVFARECLESENLEKGFPLVMIWGDSHGAQLFRAVESLHGAHRFSLAQFTSSSCPPIVDFSSKKRSTCRQINQTIEGTIRQLRPAMVILAADWSQSIGEGSLQGLEATVRFLRTNGADRVILVGPTPHWKGSLTQALFRYLTLTRQFNREREIPIPKRMRFGLTDGIDALDARMDSIAKSLGITYVSPLTVLCDQEGCLVRTDGPDAALTSFDAAHLTWQASKLLIDTVKGEMGGPFALPHPPARP